MQGQQSLDSFVRLFGFFAQLLLNGVTLDGCAA